MTHNLRRQPGSHTRNRGGRGNRGTCAGPRPRHAVPKPLTPTGVRCSTPKRLPQHRKLHGLHTTAALSPGVNITIIINTKPPFETLVDSVFHVVCGAAA